MRMCGGSVPPGWNPAIRGFAATRRSVYKHTARPAARGNLKAVRSEVRGQWARGSRRGERLPPPTRVVGWPTGRPCHGPGLPGATWCARGPARRRAPPPTASAAPPGGACCPMRTRRAPLPLPSGVRAVHACRFLTHAGKGTGGPRSRGRRLLRGGRRLGER